MVVAGRSDEYRRRAQQCLEMTAAFGDRNARVALSHMAQAWLRLAERHDFMPRPQPSPWSSSNSRSGLSRLSVGRPASVRKIVGDFVLFCGLVAFVFAIVLAAATLLT